MNRFTQLVGTLSVSALCAIGTIASADPILEVQIKDGEVAEYTLKDLLELPITAISTMNEWVDEETVFSGPLVRDFLGEIGPEMPDSVTLRAINDYSVEIPSLDFETWDVIMAVRMNGELLSLRDKGPIWIIYPASDFEELRDPLYNSRHIWQVVRMELN